MAIDRGPARVQARRAMIRALSCLLLAAASATAAPAAAQTAEWPPAPRYLPPPLAGEPPAAAVQCLALAITYEAGHEPRAGQEAVAQVILNRVRHAAYPDTVCGVVWQGSERRTGCQFTFTCDGSLRRPRSAAALARAQGVAVQVLGGLTADHVRGATHYHADYVAPYWAPSLTRVRQIARHIFYRIPGAPAGSPGGAPITVALSAERPARAADPAPAPAPEPAIRNGQFAPWGLSLAPERR